MVLSFVDELIYQEYSDREVKSWDYLATSRININVINACSPVENKETQKDQQDEDRAMAWKRFSRPSALRTATEITSWDYLASRRLYRAMEVYFSERTHFERASAILDSYSAEN